MISVTVSKPDPALGPEFASLGAASNAFMDPVALKAASETLLAVISVLLAWDTGVEPARLVGFWALQSRPLFGVLPPVLESLPYNYAFLSTPVIAPGYAETVMPAFLGAIARERTLPKTVWMMDVDAEGLGYAALQQALSERPHVLVKSSARPVVTQAFGLKRSGSTRKKLRQDWNRLAAAGALDMVNERTGPAARAALEHFLALEQKSWKGNQGTALASDPRDAAFARRLIGDMADKGDASVALLRLDGRPVAAQVLLYAGRAAFTWKTAFDPDFAKFSPGALLVDRVSMNLIDSNTVDTIDSCALESGFMGQLWAGRKQVADLVFAVTPAYSPSFLLTTAYRYGKQRLRQWRNRLRERGNRLPKQPAVARPTEAEMIAAISAPDEARPAPSAPASKPGRAA